MLPFVAGWGLFKDEAFRLVDTTKSKQSRFGPRNRWTNNRGRGRGRGGRFGGRFESTRGQPAASQGGQAGKDRYNHKQLAVSMLATSTFSMKLVSAYGVL